MSRARINADQAHTESLSVVPHIIPDVLYPAVANIMVDGSTALSAVTTGPNSSTVASSKYGTVQSDGRMYYYTDIKGSKPIKDPRIGSHFGSQRHKFKSLQILEQETATHGSNVYSVDGREWVRAISGTSDWKIVNDSWGHYINNPPTCTGAIIEIVGYFNDINFIHSSHTDRCDDVDVYVNGTISVDGSTTLAGDATVSSPLGARYVDPGSVINGGSTLSASLGTTPKINTLKFEAKTGSSEHLRFFGIELIAQDTSNVNNIQIPSQNVVSYGKKFTVSGTPHYNPFAFAGDGTTAVAIGDTTSHGKVADGWTGSTATYFDSTLDTATSLGLSAWETGGDFYRPVNGGRVVRWVDSSGNIKTSVNMMPPCATAITAGSDAALPTSHAWTTVYQPKIKSGSIDHSLAEVAKTFHWREFGNGSANGGTGATLADASMLSSTQDDIAYVMDDGLTSLSGNELGTGNVNSTAGNPMVELSTTGDYLFLTFIGTGFSLIEKDDTTGNDDGGYDWYVDGVKVKDTGFEGSTSQVTHTLAQNLPYGTHIVKLDRAATVNNFDMFFDSFTFHQPKRPPIPEDAVVIADYMLMADFVKQTDCEFTQVSKGTRLCHASRDVFYGGDISSSSVQVVTNNMFGLTGGHSGNSGTSYMQLPFFGTNAVIQLQGSNIAHTVDFGGATNVAKTALDNSVDAHGDMYTLNSSATLGVNTIKTIVVNGGYNFNAYFTATPIHTSSHYQTFETPFLHELVGGDRNMEQTNLVVTPDGKTWDEVTRDVSYMGNMCLHTSSANTSTTGNTTVNVMTRWRGHEISGREPHARFNKDFVIAYDRMICLKAGQYQIKSQTRTTNASGQTGGISINGTVVLTALSSGTAGATTNIVTVNLARSDYIQIIGCWNSDGFYSSFEIIKVN